MTVPADGDFSLLTAEELFALYRDGNPAAGEELAKQISPALFAFFTHYLGNREAAETALSATFREIAKRAYAYHPLTRFAFFLYQIAREIALDSLVAQPPVERDSLENLLLDNLPENLDAEELGRRLAGAIPALPLSQKDVFLLREDADLTFGEITEILNCSPEQAQNHLRAALGNLAAALERAPKICALLKHL